MTALQNALRNSTELGSPVRTFDGTMVRGFDVNPDGNWGPATYRALWAYLNLQNTNQAILNGIASAARAHTITPSAVTMAADIALRSFGYHLPYPPRVPTNSLLPMYGVASPGSSTSIFQVSDATQAEQDGASIVNPQTATPAPSSARTQESQEQPQPQSQPQQPAPQEQITPLPTGDTSTIQAGNNGISWGPILVTAGAVAAFALIAYSLNQPSRRLARGNPRMYGPKLARAYLRRVYLVGRAGGHSPAYMPGKHGKYMGAGAPVYEYDIDTGDVYESGTVRAHSREEAMAKVRAMYPNVRFTGRL